MKKDYITRLLYTMIISVAIYFSVSSLFFNESLEYESVVKSIGIGVGIWLISEIMFEVVLKKWEYHIWSGYVVLFIIIALGTAAGTWILGVQRISLILLICLFAEVFGILIAILYRQIYKKRLNDQLEQYKKEQNR